MALEKLFLTLFGLKIFSTCPIPLNEKGILNIRNSDNLVVYFPGHAQESDWSQTSNGAYGGKLQKEYWLPWAKYLLGRSESGEGNYNLEWQFKLGNLSSFVLGSSHLCTSSSQLHTLLEKAHASRIILASHSGGYQGLNETLRKLDASLLRRIDRIALLDNFYSYGQGKLDQTLKQKFPENLSSICRGFYTDHLEENYRNFYSEPCPLIEKRVGHKSTVKNNLGDFL